MSVLYGAQHRPHIELRDQGRDIVLVDKGYERSITREDLVNLAGAAGNALNDLLMVAELNRKEQH